MKYEVYGCVVSLVVGDVYGCLRFASYYVSGCEGTQSM